MSHHRESHFASLDRVQALLRQIASEETFDAQHSELLGQYRAIGFGDEAAIDRVAALEAAKEIEAQFGNMSLSELGVQLPVQEDWIYEPGYRSRDFSSEEKQYIARTVAANKAFLDAWERIRRKKERTTKP